MITVDNPGEINPGRELDALIAEIGLMSKLEEELLKIEPQIKLIQCQLEDYKKALQWYADGCPWDDTVGNEAEKAKRVLEKWKMTG